MIMINSLNNPHKAIATAKPPAPGYVNQGPRKLITCYYSPTIMRMSHPSADSSHHDDYYQ